ncbi:futalosine hydrolase [Streptomyces zingiberis]|uniref:futalosine hydrolase n=1 Tax=Streptomyces zingiberis TaxID=2053010 RepID=UPI0035D4B5FA
MVTAVPAEADAVRKGLGGPAEPNAPGPAAGTGATSRTDGPSGPGTAAAGTGAGAPGEPEPGASEPGASAAPGLGPAGPGAAGGPVRRAGRPGGTASRPGCVDVLAAGVGPAAAAAGTASALTAAALRGTPYDLVVSAGIGGGFPGVAPLGSVVVADAIIAADLGVRTPEGYLPLERLGFGRTVHAPPPGAARRAAEALGAVLAPVLTVSTVTGDAARATELAGRHPGAGAEAMEGFGVAEAAAAHGVPVLEIRAVSNTVGPRDRAAWRIPTALTALTGAFRTLAGSAGDILGGAAEVAGTDGVTGTAGADAVTRAAGTAGAGSDGDDVRQVRRTP